MASNHRKTKIIATVGPACDTIPKLMDLVKAGVDVFRLNFSHGTHENHLEVIDNILEINEMLGTHVGILADLQGPKLRVGNMENNGINIAPGDILTFVNEKCVGNKDRIYMSYSSFAKDVKPGEMVLVDDGKIRLEVISTNNKDEVKLKVLFGSFLSSKKGVNLPDTKISQPSLTEKDLEDLDFILTQPVNWIALSFVRNASDVTDLQKKIAKKNHHAKVIAKIEKPEAIKNIKEIVKVADGIMIARGDLGVEVPMEQLPSLQKRIIIRCVKMAKPVIVATQMMESMIVNPSPSRAEVTDVANAVLDGTDAVMLSGETSVGNHPVLVVKEMRKIISDAEKHFLMLVRRKDPDPQAETFLSDVLCFNAPRIAEIVHAKALTGITVNGYTAFKMSSYRPNSEIHIFSNKIHMLSTLALVWGVKGHFYSKFTTTDDTIKDVNEKLKEIGCVVPGDIVINTGSMPLQKRIRTNMLKISVVD
ncbi:MAG: pyruvate kinase [Lewinellaceae bacterium]|nr:pyruvate kinase [Lewinellaceae bacterium]